MLARRIVSPAAQEELHGLARMINSLAAQEELHGLARRFISHEPAHGAITMTELAMTELAMTELTMTELTMAELARKDVNDPVDAEPAQCGKARRRERPVGLSLYEQ